MSAGKYHLSKSIWKGFKLLARSGTNGQDSTSTNGMSGKRGHAKPTYPALSGLAHADLTSDLSTPSNCENIAANHPSQGMG
ncbi:hypothetical protein CCHR01_14149 [Colletotrichum chrysophilum]|uniref:Uncharacterized protein n=1 Tax=Colletotrichum chrysophilum TaxID=1836956 RepID=A0AAD9ECJ8_9PEZI|nr:hypothetical protein CCHR01_14149 [Colletotrichum chrysophilum]